MKHELDVFHPTYGFAVIELPVDELGFDEYKDQHHGELVKVRFYGKYVDVKINDLMLKRVWNNLQNKRGNKNSSIKNDVLDAESQYILSQQYVRIVE